MDVHDFASAFSVGNTDFDFSVEATWSTKSWVKGIPAVGGADDDHVVAAMHTVHQRQHLGDHAPFDFPGYVLTLRANGVDLVNENDGGGIFSCLVEDFTKLFLGFTVIL